MCTKIKATRGEGERVEGREALGSYARQGRKGEGICILISPIYTYTGEERRVPPMMGLGFAVGRLQGGEARRPEWRVELNRQ